MSKKRGIAAERELLHLLWERGFAVARVAGSGSVPEPSCDLLAGNGREKFAIECKMSGNGTKYITKAQMDDFVAFSERFGLQPLIAIKFLRKGWFFLSPEELKKTGKGFSITLEQATGRGIKLI